MKKITLLISWLGLVSNYSSQINAISARATTALSLVDNVFLLYVCGTIENNISFIHSAYINACREDINKLIRTMRQDEKCKSLKELSVLFADLLRCKNSILRSLEIEKNDIHHDSIDMNNPSIYGVISVIDFVNLNALRASVTFLCDYSQICIDKKYCEYEQIAKYTADLIQKIEDIKIRIQNLTYEENIFEGISVMSDDKKKVLRDLLEKLTQQVNNIKQQLDLSD